MIDKVYGMFRPVCDCCNKELDDCETWQEAVDLMKQEGWIYNFKHENICKQCKVLR